MPQEGISAMEATWEKNLACTLACSRCNRGLGPDDQRILSVYDHAAICLECKKREEAQPDYEQTSRNMVGQCLMDVELSQSDPGGFCYFHFYPYTCRE
jgi:hypothetical protein